MEIAHLTTILAVFLSGLLPASCSKTRPAAAKTTAVAVNPNVKNLGEVSLTNHFETRVLLDAGRSCIITPRFLDRSNVRLSLAVESKNSSGHIDGLSVTEVVASQGKVIEVELGGLNISLTPNVVTK
jgi:hypothetical protein